MNAPEKHLSVFVDESGRGRPDNRNNPNQPYFVVGVFVTSHAPDLTAIVNGVCDEENFRRTLHWRVFNNTAARVYVRVAERLHEDLRWEYKATSFQADAIDLRYLGEQARDSISLGREHVAYNFFVKQGILAALRYSALVAEATHIDIVADEKTRTNNDNFTTYLRSSLAKAYPGKIIDARDCPDEEERLLQVCDIMTGALNTKMVKISGAAKLRAAERVFAARCKHYKHPLQAWP